MADYVSYYTPTDDEIRASTTRLGAWSGDAYDRWLAAHDAALRKSIAAAIEDCNDHCHDQWDEAITLAASIARGEPPTT
ncbi:hypothetical protein GCM10009785_19740 [Brooklawnia cerclae]|uniref:Antitoxin n=1 Tax=Brooklawnia cerclae TaxID=349934 RepID=A0ABX0SH58_9ACTN|nr:hypothetical protein [Brooklawnia cerclae]NIH57286.1 hypothetical protein [Brooklawnia cerclae]